MRFIVVHDLQLLLPGTPCPRMTSPSAWTRPCLPAGALLAGGPLLGLLGLRGGLLCGHSERSDGGEGWDGELDGNGALGRLTGRLNAQLSLKVVRKAGQAGGRLLLVALALALVAEQLTSPHAQEALGTGV